MVFSTIGFLCGFLPITLLLYFLVPKQGKNLVLLLASLFFYAFGEPRFIFVMLGSIALNYAFGMAIHHLQKNRRKAVLILGILSNLGLLIIFKYFNLLADTLGTILGRDLNVIAIALPIGISFYTFQGMSYVIDVYRSECRMDENGNKDDNKISIVQKNPLKLALYISMFPQLIAGPIIRYVDIKDSLDERKSKLEDISRGIERFIRGLAKKAILANVIGELANQIITGDYSYMSTSVAWLGAIAYSLQIFFDFSGYSDMAIGLGRIFGFQFAENFDYPYMSCSVKEFWRRWHITLSTWFRDYLYIPLGGNRRGNVYFNLLIVFMATGIWHGASWNFLFWGLWHGMFLVIERVVSKHIPNIKFFGKKALGYVYTVLVVITGWVLFALVKLEDVWKYLKVMFHVSGNDFIAFDIRYYLTNHRLVIMAIAILCSFPIFSICTTWIQKKLEQSQIGALVCLIAKRICLLVLLGISFIYIINSSYNPFIYFRF